MQDPPNMEDAERELAQLPRGTATRTVEVLIGWLRDNRRVLQDQIAGLAIRFEEVNREDKARLGEISREVKRTNGRVTDLEKIRAVDHALADGHTSWEHTRQEVDEAKLVAKHLAREKRLERFERAGLIVFGLAAGSFGHKFGLW